MERNRVGYFMIFGQLAIGKIAGNMERVSNGADNEGSKKWHI